MKAVTSPNELETRNQRLNQALMEMHCRAVADGESVYNLSLAVKEKLYFQELERQEKDQYWQQYRNSLLEQRRRLDIGFPLFHLLPKELRLHIWSHAVCEDLRPRIHIITKKKGRCVSNQDVSALLGVCAESRIAYLNPGVEPAFNTYVLFKTDIFYIRPFSNSQGFGPWCTDLDGSLKREPTLFEDKEPLIQRIESSHEEDEREELEAAYQAGALPTFASFLDDPSARNIRSLAMTIDFFTNNPLHVGVTPRDTLSMMRGLMPMLDEILLVFNDVRVDTIAWIDTDASFRGSCPTDQMRTLHQIAGVKRYISRMRPSWEPRQEEMVFRFVFVAQEDKRETRVPEDEDAIDALIEDLRSGFKTMH